MRVREPASARTCCGDTSGTVRRASSRMSREDLAMEPVYPKPDLRSLDSVSPSRGGVPEPVWRACAPLASRPRRCRRGAGACAACRPDASREPCLTRFSAAARPGALPVPELRPICGVCRRGVCPAPVRRICEACRPGASRVRLTRPLAGVQPDASQVRSREPMLPRAMASMPSLRGWCAPSPRDVPRGRGRGCAPRGWR